jgi:hypothetical protein
MQLAGLRVLLTKCNFSDFDEEIDLHNKAKLFQLFQQKKIGKMSRYISKLISLDADLR